MQYRAIGLMSGSSLDGLDIAFVEFSEQGGKWEYQILQAECYPYPEEWISRLKDAIHLPARDYQLLHTDYGHYTGQQVNRFIESYQLQYQVSVIGSHGHTTFHMPERKMTAQLGDGAALAAETGLPVVSDLRAMDIALGGQGAPIVPIGEKMLLSGYDYFLNIGGIANIAVTGEPPLGGWGFDICPANRVLNMLANQAGMEYDAGGEMAASGKLNEALLEQLNQLGYYKQPPPKSLANDFGTDVVYPLIKKAGISIPDALRTFCEHIAQQTVLAIQGIGAPSSGGKLLATGGGAFNDFLTGLIQQHLAPLGITLETPDPKLINYKEAMVMAFMAVLRWRQENNVLASVTGASRDSIGGALWMGQDA